MSTLFLSHMHIRKKSSQPLTTQHLCEETPSWGTLKTFFAERSRPKNAEKLKRESRSRQRRHKSKECAKGQTSGYTDYPVRIYGQLPPDGIPRPPSFIHAAPIKCFQEPQPDNLFYESDPFAATPTASSFEKSSQYSFPFSHSPEYNSEPASLKNHSTALQTPPSPSFINGPESHDSLESRQSVPMQEHAHISSTASSVYSAKSSSYSNDRSQKLAPPDALVANVFGNSPGSQSSVLAGSPILRHSPVHDSGVFLSEAYTIPGVEKPPSRSGRVSPKHRPAPLNIPHNSLYDSFQLLASNQPHKTVMNTARSSVAGNDDETSREDVSRECDSDDDADNDTHDLSLSSESDIESDTSEYLDCIPCSPQADYRTTSERIESRSGQVQVDLGGTKDAWEATQPNATNSKPEQGIDSARATMHNLGMASLKSELDAIQKAPSHKIDIGTRATNAPLVMNSPRQKPRSPSKYELPRFHDSHSNTRRPLKTSESSPHLMFYRPSSHSCQTSKPSSNYPDTVVYFRSRDAPSRGNSQRVCGS